MVGLVPDRTGHVQAFPVVRKPCTMSMVVRKMTVHYTSIQRSLKRAAQVPEAR